MAGNEGADGSSSSSSSCPSLFPLPKLNVGTGAGVVGACGLRRGSCFLKGGGGGGMALRSKSAFALLLLIGGSALVIIGSWISFFSGASMGMGTGFGFESLPFSAIATVFSGR